MFAGPNGSGKTTVKNSLSKPASWFGSYINPDDLEKAVRTTGKLPIQQFGLTATTSDVRMHFASSPLFTKHFLASDVDAILCQENVIDFHEMKFNSYSASVLSDYLRRRAMEAGKSFSFETVMSANDKVELLREAQEKGYRTYIYFVATEDPAINVQRVRHRVAEGGHDVPEEKIVARYYRSLALIKKAIRHANRAFFFDTSEEEASFFAEITDGNSLELKSDEIPAWFQPIWDSIP